MLNSIISVIFSFFAGYIFLSFLVVKPENMVRSLFLVNLFCFISISMLFFIGQLSILSLSITLNIFSFILGYYIHTHKFLSIEERDNIEPNFKNLKNNNIAIIYLTHGEPPTYNPEPWLHTFKEFDETNVKFVPKFFRPFFIYNLRKHYLIVGKSNHRDEHYRMFESLKKSIRSVDKIIINYYIAFLDDYPSLYNALFLAVSQGAKKIIISEVFLTTSNHTEEAKIIVKRLNLKQNGVELFYTGPLWNSEKLYSAFVKKVLDNTEDYEKSEIGVLLIGHGQPDEWDHEFETETNQEIIFRENIKHKLIENGYKSKNIVSAWMEFKKPNPKDVIPNLIENGVHKILYFAAAISADAIHSQYDIPKLIEEVKIPETIEVQNLGAWNNNPLVIEAISDRIKIQLDKIISSNILN